MRVRSLLVPLLLCAALWGHSLPSCARSASSGPQPDPIVRLGISNYATPTPHENGLTNAAQIYNFPPMY